MKPVKIIGVFIGVVSLLFLANVCYGAKVTTTVTSDSGVVVSSATDQGASSDGDVRTAYADFAGNMIKVTSHYKGNGVFTITFLRNYKGIHSNLSYTIQVTDPEVVPDVSKLSLMAKRDSKCEQAEVTECGPYSGMDPCTGNLCEGLGPDCALLDCEGHWTHWCSDDPTEPCCNMVGDVILYCPYQGPVWSWNKGDRCGSFCFYSIWSSTGLTTGSKVSYNYIDYDRPNFDGAKILLNGVIVEGVDDFGNPSTAFEDQVDKITAKETSPSGSLKTQICRIMNDHKVANDYCDNAAMLNVATVSELEAAAIIMPMLSAHGISNGLAILARTVPHLVDDGTPAHEWTLKELNRWLFEEDSLVPLPTP